MVATGDSVGALQFVGHTGAAYANVVSLSGVVDSVAGTAVGGRFEITISNAAGGIGVRWRFYGDGSFVPALDATYNIGTSALRAATVYASSGVVTTSDSREKTEVREFTENELSASKALAKEIGFFQFLGSVAAKGEDTARMHCGITVQRAIEIMEQYGLDPFRYEIGRAHV